MPLHRGKIATHPEIVSIRPLTREDLGLIEASRKHKDAVGTSAVSRFRDPHHRIARLFASGLKTREIQERTGYSYARLSQYRNDPAFQDLVAKYREKVDAQWAESVDAFYDDATANMRKAERMIAERLEEAEDEGGTPIPLKTLVDISSDRMDRFGYGKKQTNLNVNVDFAKQLEDAISRSGKATVIEATAVHLPASASVPRSPAEPQPPSPLPGTFPSSAPVTSAPLVPRQGGEVEPAMVSAPRSQPPTLDRRVLRRA